MKNTLLGRKIYFHIWICQNDRSMSGFGILDLVIGVIFIYFLLSIICSSAVELFLSFRRTRAKVIAKWLRTVFDMEAIDSHGAPMLKSNGKPKTLGEAIMDHCMTTALTKEGVSTAYISAQNFVSALLDKITISASSEKSDDNVLLPPENIEQYIAAIKQSKVISGELKRVILAFAYQAKASEPLRQNVTTDKPGSIQSRMDDFRIRLEHWYDLNADRLTGTFKRTKVWPLNILLAIIVTITINVDSVAITRYLYYHKEEAKEFADNAERTIENYKERLTQTSGESNPDLDQNTARLKADVDSLLSTVPEDLPLGWTSNDKTTWKTHIVGWIATILAIIMGAPFWFDLLNKVSNLRATGPKPDPTKEINNA